MRITEKQLRYMAAGISHTIPGGYSVRIDKTACVDQRVLWEGKTRKVFKSNRQMFDYLSEKIDREYIRIVLEEEVEKAVKELEAQA